MQVKNNKIRWTTLEVEILSNSLEEGLTCASIELLLPGRTVKSIRRKALRLGWSSFTKSDHIYFKYGIQQRKRKVHFSSQKKSNVSKNKIMKIIKSSISTILKPWSKHYAS